MIGLFSPPVPLAILWSITRACNLACRHCHAVGKPGEGADELSTDEALALVDRLTRWGVYCVVLTGGEPLMRRDVFDIARHIAERGLDEWLITNGWLVNARASRDIASIGFARVLVSVDSAQPERHDLFRNRHGSFRRAMMAIQRLTDVGVHVGLITTINRMNVDELEDIVALAQRLGVTHVNFQTFKPTRASQTQQWEGQPMNLTPAEWRAVLSRLLRIRRETSDMTFDIGSGGREPTTSLLNGAGDSCLACECGTTLGSVEANGDVTYCIYAPDLIIGNLRHDDLPELWRSAPLLKRMRTRSPVGKCQQCGRFAQCGGGCPAVTWNLLGHLDAPDPNCWWKPEIEKET